MITHTDHPIVAEVASLRKRPGRESSGCVIVEGLPEVTRAQEAAVPFRKLIYCEELCDFDVAQFAADERLEVNKAVFAACAFGHRLKGIIALCQPKQLSLDDLTLRSNPLIVVLESVEKPGNLGAVIRSADAADVDAIFLANGKTDVYNQHVVRSSVGMVFHVPVLDLDNESAAAFLERNKIAICAATSKARQPYTDCRFDLPVAMVVGNEHDGLSPFWIERSDQQVIIPMHGVGACLNVTVSASILLFEAIRQRRSGHNGSE